MPTISTTIYKSTRCVHYSSHNRYRVFADSYGIPATFVMLSKVTDQFLLFPNLKSAKNYADEVWEFLMNPAVNPAEHALLKFYTFPQIKRLDGPLPESIAQLTTDPHLYQLAAFKERSPFCKHLMGEIPQYEITPGVKVEGRTLLRFCGRLCEPSHSRCNLHKF
jgi:hypothetical protein